MSQKPGTFSNIHRRLVPWKFTQIRQIRCKSKNPFLMNTLWRNKHVCCVEVLQRLWEWCKVCVPQHVRLTKRKNTLRRKLIKMVQHNIFNTTFREQTPGEVWWVFETHCRSRESADNAAYRLLIASKFSFFFFFIAPFIQITEPVALIITKLKNVKPIHVICDWQPIIWSEHRKTRYSTQYL